MPLVNARCTNCDANLTVDRSKEAAVCEHCGSAFIVEKAINNYITNNSFAGATINISGVSIESKLTAIERLMNNKLYDDGFRQIMQIKRDYPEDYRPWYYSAKYYYEIKDEWLDDSKDFQKAKALADDEGKRIIEEYYKEEYEKVLERSQDIVSFSNSRNYDKLYYSYLKWYFSNTLNDAQGYGYFGFEPINGTPSIVSYAKNDKYGFVKRVLSTSFSVKKIIRQKKIVLAIMVDNEFLWLPENTKNEFHYGGTIGSTKPCRLYITGFSSNGVIYNRAPEDMIYGDVLSSKSTDFNKTGGCYIATAVYGSYDCPQVWTLRRYRDDILAKNWYGKMFIRAYYAISPTLVKLFGKTNWFKNMWKPKLDRMVIRLNSKGISNKPYYDNNY